MQGESGENKMNEYESSSHYAMLCYAVLDRYPTILPFQSQSPRALVVLLGLPNLFNSSIRSCGAAWAELWSPARSTLGKSHTDLIHVVAALKEPAPSSDW